MVHKPVTQDQDAQHTKAPVPHSHSFPTHTTHIIIDGDREPNCDQASTDPNTSKCTNDPNPHPHPNHNPSPVIAARTDMNIDADTNMNLISTPDSPTAPSHGVRDDQYLTSVEPAGPLPNPWRNILRAGKIADVQRLYVAADGSCAGGSIMLARSDEVLGDIQPSRARQASAVAQFRCTHIADYVDAWTDQQWCEYIPEILIEYRIHADSYCECTLPLSAGGVCDSATCGKPSKAKLQRQLFVSSCRMSHCAIDPLFFYVVTMALGVGVLLLVRDERHAFNAKDRAIDFGTTQYPHSMIIYASFHRPPSAGIGHYETVGIKKTNEEGHQTLFLSSSSILTRLRTSAEQRSDPRTLESISITYWSLPAVFSAPIPTWRTNSNTNMTTHLSNANAAPPPTPVTTAPTTPRQPRQRQATEKQRQLDREKQQTTAKRSLSKRINAVEVHQQSTISAAPVPLGKRSQSLPLTQPVNAATPLSTTSPTSAATSSVPISSVFPPTSTSAKCESMATQILANVRKWIRRTRPEHRLAGRVHYTAIPMWTLRCRSVLQALATALRGQPMDVHAIITNLCILWMLPTEVFSSPSRTGGGAQRRKSRHRRIHHLLSDDQLIGRMMQELTTGLDNIHTSSYSDSDEADWALLASLSLPIEQQKTASSALDADPDSSHSASADLHSGTDVYGGGCSSQLGPAEVSTISSSSSSSLYRESETVHHDRKERDRRCIQRVQKLFEDGHSHKAMETLSSATELADLNSPEERAKLRTLHPSSQQPIHECPWDAPEIAVDWRWIQLEMIASDNGSASGPSSYGSNYLSVLATDQHCVDALTFLIQQIVNNRLPNVVRTLLTTCLLVSLVKDEKGGRRPIAIGDIFYRMAARYAVSLVTDKVQKKLAPHQYGVGTSDGCTQIVQSIQHILTHDAQKSAPGTSPQDMKAGAAESQTTPTRPMACLSIDIANAFNTIDRAVMLRTLYSDVSLRQCWKAVAFGYGKPSLLLMQTDECIADDEAFIESRAGVRQGDPLAALLFSLAMHDVYDRLARKVSAGCYAYVDDAHFLGTLEECLLVWRQLPALLAPLGLSVNPSKCELTCFSMQHIDHDSDRRALDAFQSSPIKINGSSLKLLGCVVAVDNKTIADTLISKSNSSANTSTTTTTTTVTSLRMAQQTALRRIPLLKKQTAMLALQRLSGVVINNQLRAMPPMATLKHARRYDAEVMKVAHTIIGITREDKDKYDAQIQSPLSMGGFGLISAERIAAAAYIAGAENTLRHSPAFANIWNEDEPLPSASPMYHAISDSLQRVTALTSALIKECEAKYVGDDIKDISTLLPDSTNTFIQYFKSRPSSVIQSTVTHRISTLSFIARVSLAARAEKNGRSTIARLQSLKETGAALWLQTLPTEKALTLSDDKWIWPARLRLGMPVPTTHTMCSKCRRSDAYARDSWHALSCTALSGAAMTDRHNDVLMKLAQFATLAQLNNRTEPASLDHDHSKKRPDIQITLPDKTLLGDVTVTHPTSHSWKHKACKQGIETIGDIRERMKNALYADMAAANDMDFIAIVLYTHGGLHRSALRFIQRLTNSLDPVTSLLSRSEFNFMLRQHIAIAVQRGNATIMMQDQYRQRDRVGGRWLQAYERIRSTMSKYGQMKKDHQAEHNYRDDNWQAYNYSNTDGDTITDDCTVVVTTDVDAASTHHCTGHYVNVDVTSKAATHSAAVSAAESDSSNICDKRMMGSITTSADHGNRGSNTGSCYNNNDDNQNHIDSDNDRIDHQLQYMNDGTDHGNRMDMMSTDKTNVNMNSHANMKAISMDVEVEVALIETNNNRITPLIADQTECIKIGTVTDPDKGMTEMQMQHSDRDSDRDRDPNTDRGGGRNGQDRGGRLTDRIGVNSTCIASGTDHGDVHHHGVTNVCVLYDNDHDDHNNNDNMNVSSVSCDPSVDHNVTGSQ